MKNELELNLESTKQIAPELAEMAVRLVSVLAERNPPVELGKLSFTLSTAGAEWVRGEELDRVIMIYPFEVTVHSSNDEGETSDAARLGLTYHVIYLFKHSLERSADAALQSFLAFYGSIHIWPYARAEIEHLSAKVGLPPLTLPVLNMGTLPSGFTIAPLRPKEPSESVQQLP